MEERKKYWDQFSNYVKMGVMLRVLIQGNYHLIDLAAEYGEEEKMKDYIKKLLVVYREPTSYDERLKLVEEIRNYICSLLARTDDDYHEVAKRIRDYDYMNRKNISLIYRMDADTDTKNQK